MEISKETKAENATKIILNKHWSIWPPGSTFIWYWGMWREGKAYCVGISKERMYWLLEIGVAKYL